ncbi:MAG TPA: hypothetical protein VNO70_07935 [Blastocatellia bacterium]|nr:hypothetical protein [Blastocatellia bacterium]
MPVAGGADGRDRLPADRLPAMPGRGFIIGYRCARCHGCDQIEHRVEYKGGQ